MENKSPYVKHRVALCWWSMTGQYVNSEAIIRS